MNAEGISPYFILVQLQVFPPKSVLTSLTFPCLDRIFTAIMPMVAAGLLQDDPTMLPIRRLRSFVWPLQWQTPDPWPCPVSSSCVPISSLDATAQCKCVRRRVLSNEKCTGRFAQIRLFCICFKYYNIYIIYSILLIFIYIINNKKGHPTLHSF